MGIGHWSLRIGYCSLVIGYWVLGISINNQSPIPKFNEQLEMARTAIQKDRLGVYVSLLYSKSTPCLAMANQESLLLYYKRSPQPPRTYRDSFLFQVIFSHASL
jgi:hypothetical protein